MIWDMMRVHGQQPITLAMPREIFTGALLGRDVDEENPRVMLPGFYIRCRCILYIQV